MLSLYEFLWNVFNSKTVLIIGAWGKFATYIDIDCNV